MTFAGAALARSDPAALDRVVAKAQTPDAPLDETNIAFAFGNELNRAPLAIPDGSAPLSLSAGVMKIGPIKIPEGQGDEALSADLDLRTLTTQTRFTLTSSASDLKFWSGPPPSAGVTVDNALEAPKRQIDVSSLSAALAAQAIARETDRISTMEADIRERAFFNRRLKGERFMDRRQQEIQDWEVEQARLKGQAERLRSLEEAEKAAEAEAAKRAAEAATSGRKPRRRRAQRTARSSEGRRRRPTDESRRSRPLRRRRATKSAPTGPAPRPRRPRPGPRRARRKSTRRQATLLIRTERRCRPRGSRSDSPAPSASSTNTRMADDRLAPPREASIIAARRLRDSPRSAAMARSRRQNASSRETLVRCPAMTSERLTTRAFALSVAIGLLRGGGRRGWPRRARARSR